jgi:hypothetical protein
VTSFTVSPRWKFPRLVGLGVDRHLVDTHGPSPCAEDPGRQVWIDGPRRAERRRHRVANPIAVGVDDVHAEDEDIAFGHPNPIDLLHIGEQ